MEKRNVVSRLLRALKEINVEQVKLEEFGIHLKSISEVETILLNCIKTVVGMPEEEIMSEWTRDWTGIIFAYVDDELSEEDAISELVNWMEQK